MCGWKNMLVKIGNKRVFWLRIKPNSMYISGTFLKFDHTTRSTQGNYLIWPLQMQTHTSSILKSPLMHRKSPKICFSLYYFARASNNTVPAFRVRFVDLTRHTSSFEVVNGTRILDDWILYRREISNLPQTYQFFIESFYSGAILSDIGVDDIKIENRPCWNDSMSSSSTTPMPSSERYLDCNFDNPPCLWDYDTNVWNNTDFKERMFDLIYDFFGFKH